MESLTVRRDYSFKSEVGRRGQERGREGGELYIEVVYINLYFENFLKK